MTISRLALSVILCAATAACSIDYSTKTNAIEKPRNYFEMVQRHIASSIQYPHRSIRAGEQGVCRIKVEFSRDGTVLNSSLVKSAGYADLDAECLAVAARASPFPPAPESLSPDVQTFAIDMPLSFALTSK